MHSKKILDSIIVVGIVVMYVFLGCEGDQGPAGPIGPMGPTGPAGETPEVLPFISGIVSAPGHDIDLWDLYGTADISIINIPGLPSVSVNGNSLIPGLKTTDGLLNYNHGAFPILAGDSAFLQIDYTKSDNSGALASAGILIPGYFDIVSSVQDISRSDTARLDWSPSIGASGYYVRLSTSVIYIDTMAQKMKIVYDLDTIVADTFFELSAEPFFPDSEAVFSYDSYSSELTIDAVNGPIFAGNTGNVIGDGYGFFFGWNYGHRIDFTLSTGGKQASSNADQFERIKAFIQRRMSSSTASRMEKREFILRRDR